MDSDFSTDEQKPEDKIGSETPAKACKAQVEYIFLIRGRNCAKTIGKCLRSIKKQTHTNWRAAICLDAPTDNSEDVTKKLIDGDERFFITVNTENYGVCKNMYKIITWAELVVEPKDEDVAVIVDADDYISKDALKKVNAKYRKGALITHGSYKKMSVGRRTKISRAYPKSGNVRKLPWRGSHLKTIKWKVIRRAKPDWFRHKGKWLQAASDLALMFNCIEIAGLKNVAHVHDVIYYWNNSMTEKKRALQKRCEKILRNK